MRLFSIFHRKPVIRCCIRSCNSKAKYAAGIKRIEEIQCMGSSVYGTIRPICDSEECLETMKRVEKTDQITLTPIGISIYSVAA